MERVKISPALLGAKTLENAIVAATPGGIECQEAAGQKMLIESAQLPIDMGSMTIERLEAIGFKIGGKIDELFMQAELPPGWTKVASEHSMHSKLIDENGCERASVFYKAAFYDRRADITFNRRFSIAVDYATRGSNLFNRVYVVDRGSEITTLGSYKPGAYADEDALREQAKAWLNEKYPNWQDPLAYWDRESLMAAADEGADSTG